jgi:hypothetical protein
MTENSKENSAHIVLAKQTWPAIIGFTAGAGLGAACFAAAGLWSLALPAGLALLALAMGLAVNLDGAQR